jgi:hypothetical protein
MRKRFDGLWVALHVAVGTWALALVSQRWWGAVLALVMYAQAFKSLGLSESLRSFRDRMRLSGIRCLQLFCGAYSLAGAVACVGALVSLPRAVGLIVAFGAFSFSWFWGYGLRELLRSTGHGEPGPS